MVLFLFLLKTNSNIHMSSVIKYDLFFSLTTCLYMLTFSQISVYFSKSYLSFIKEDIHSVSSKFILYTFISGNNIHYKGLVF